MHSNINVYKDAVLRFLSRDGVVSASVATVDEAGRPHSAIIYFYADEALNFYFLTPTETNKHKNLLHDHSVALAIGEAKEYTTVQVQGTAELLSRGSETEHGTLAKLKNRLIDAGVTWPIYQLSDYDDSAIAVFKVTPTSLRYLNLEKDSGLPVTTEGIVTVM